MTETTPRTEAELYGQPNVTERPVAFWHGASASNSTLLLAGIVVSPGELAEIRRESFAAGRAAVLEDIAERLPAALRDRFGDAVPPTRVTTKADYWRGAADAVLALLRDLAAVDPDEVLAIEAEATQGVDALRRAVTDEGPQPRQHHAVMAKHRREWPVLWAAIDALLADTSGGTP